MSDDKNRDLHTWIEPEIEARLAALVLGEASDFEKDELERLMGERTELRLCKERLETVHGLLQDAVKPGDDDQWLLSPGRRAGLMEKLGMEPEADEAVVPLSGTGQHRESRIRRQGLKVAVMAAACLMISLLLAPYFLNVEGERAGRAESAAAPAMDGWKSANASRERVRLAGAEIDGRGLEGYEADAPAGLEEAAPQSGRRAASSLRALRENLNRAELLDVAGETVAPSDHLSWNGREAEGEKAKGSRIVDQIPPAEQPTVAPAPIPDFDRAGIAGDLVEDGVALGGGAGGPQPASRPAEPSVLHGRKNVPADQAPDDAFGTNPARNGVVEGAAKDADATLGDRDDFRRPADPGVAGGRKEQGDHTGPVRTNPAVDDKQSGNVDQVRRGLEIGEGYYNLGHLDEAKKEYEEVLRTDPYNTEARQGLERAAAAKSDYYRAAYDETRARLLAEVDQAWELAVPPVANKPGQGQKGNAGPEADSGIFPVTPATPAIPGASDSRFRFPTEYEPPELPNSVGGGITSGLRSGDAAVTRNSIDAILNVPQPSAEPGGKGAERTEELGGEGAFSVSGGVIAGQDAESDGMRGDDNVRGTTYSGHHLGVADEQGRQDGQLGEELQRQLEDLELNFKREKAMKEPAADPFAVAEEVPALEGAELEVEQLREMKKLGEEPEPNTTGVESLEKQRETRWFKEEALEDSPAYVTNRLKSIVIPEIDFEDTTVEEAIDFLRQRSRELDVMELDPERKGISFVLRKTQVEGGVSDEALDADLGLGSGDVGSAPIKSLKLKDVPLETALQHIADQAGLRYKVDEHGITLLPASAGEGEDAVTRKWTVPAGVVEKWKAAASGDDPFAASGLSRSKSLKEVLAGHGVQFPEGASAVYLPGSQMLVVKNTTTNLDLVDALVESEPEPAPEEVARDEMEKHTSAEPFSTFSLHVSDVSFKLAQAALAQGGFPEAGKVRVEEFVNAFDYGDPAPSQDERVACQVEQAAHPFMQQRNVMRIAMRTAAVGRAAGTPLRLTILLDNSGSMDRADRAESVQRAFGLLADQLTAQDEVTLIGFARTPRLLREDVRGDQAQELLQVIAQTPSEGGTNLEEALRLGTEKALENHLEGAQNRIILLTDGAANLGDAEPERLSQVVETLRQRGVAFDACGVGADGLNDTILEALTRKGDGRYYFLDRPEDADEGFARQIAGALRPAAKNVKVQVEFNPKRVGHYALYGFEKHELKKEDFRNDSVDAAELAAEEAGVALYHFEALPGGEGDVGTVSVRFQDTATGEMVEQLWPIPYEANPSPVEDAEPSLRLAATAAFLGETLKGSAVGDLVDLAELGRWSRSLQTVYPQSERIGQLVQMIEKVRELSGR